MAIAQVGLDQWVPDRSHFDLGIRGVLRVDPGDGSEVGSVPDVALVAGCAEQCEAGLKHLKVFTIRSEHPASLYFTGDRYCVLKKNTSSHRVRIAHPVLVLAAGLIADEDDDAVAATVAVGGDDAAADAVAAAVEKARERVHLFDKRLAVLPLLESLSSQAGCWKSGPQTVELERSAGPPARQRIEILEINIWIRLWKCDKIETRDGNSSLSPSSFKDFFRSCRRITPAAGRADGGSAAAGSGPVAEGGAVPAERVEPAAGAEEALADAVVAAAPAAVDVARVVEARPARTVRLVSALLHPGVGIAVCCPVTTEVASLLIIAHRKASFPQFLVHSSLSRPSE